MRRRQDRFELPEGAPSMRRAILSLTSPITNDDVRLFSSQFTRENRPSRKQPRLLLCSTCVPTIVFIGQALRVSGLFLWEKTTAPALDAVAADTGTSGLRGTGQSGPFAAPPKIGRDHHGPRPSFTVRRAPDLGMPHHLAPTTAAAAGGLRAVQTAHRGAPWAPLALRRRQSTLRAYAPCDTAAKRAATVSEGIAHMDRIWSAGMG